MGSKRFLGLLLICSGFASLAPQWIYAQSTQRPLRQGSVQEFDFGATLGRWRLLRSRVWQKIEENAITTATTSTPSSPCDADMVYVSGQYTNTPSSTPGPQVEALQDDRYCIEHAVSSPNHCYRYDRPGYEQAIQNLRQSLPVLPPYQSSAYRQMLSNNRGGLRGLLPMSFCIDRYEHPNQPGQNPIVATSWYDAELSCEAHGKRLCSEQEWTFACEGETAQPYPYADWEYRRFPSNGGCNVGHYGRVVTRGSGELVTQNPPPVDLPESLNRDPLCQRYRPLLDARRSEAQHAENLRARREHRTPRTIDLPSLRTLLDSPYAPRTRDYGIIVACLWHGLPSGEAQDCTSPFGVHDMTGNVDEWTVSTSGRASLDRALHAPRTHNPHSTLGYGQIRNMFPSNARAFHSRLKGGWWGPVRNRCRPVTSEHGPSFTYFNISFRCCRDAR